MSQQIIDRFRSIKNIKAVIIDHGYPSSNDALALKDIIDNNDIALLEQLEASGAALEIEIGKQTLVADKINKGKVARSICEKVLDLIAGFNIDRNSSVGDIDAIETAFAPILAALTAIRPYKAKALIDQVPVDGVMVTQEMMDAVQYIYTSEGI